MIITFKQTVLYTGRKRRSFNHTQTLSDFNIANLLETTTIFKHKLSTRIATAFRSKTPGERERMKPKGTTPKGTTPKGAKRKRETVGMEPKGQMEGTIGMQLRVRAGKQEQQEKTISKVLNKRHL